MMRKYYKMRFKILSIIATILMVVVITSCTHKDSAYDKAKNQIKEGMTYTEVCSIMGNSGTDIGSGAIIYEWKLEKDKRLLVWFSYSADLSGEMTVTEYRIE